MEAVRCGGWLVAAGLGLGVAVGCASLLGTDEFRDADAGVAAGAPNGGSGPGGGGDGPGTEDCLDRVDNNDNGWADCEDPACEPTHECAPAVPAGWIGVGWVDPTTPFAACLEGLATGLYDPADLTAEPGSCSCQCANPNVTCQASVSCANACMNGGLVSGNAVETCTDLSMPSSGPFYCWAGGLATRATECAPRLDLDAGQPDWPRAAEACLLAAPGHCPASDVCVPRAPAGANGPCIAALGESTCPESYPDLMEYWDGTVDDGRGCASTSCACALPSPGSCACTSSPCGVEVHGMASCGHPNPPVAPVDTSSCASTGTLPGTGPPYSASIALVGATVSSYGSCAPSGVASPVGSVAPAQQVTVCCR